MKFYQINCLWNICSVIFWEKVITFYIHNVFQQTLTGFVRPQHIVNYNKLEKEWFET